MDPSGVLPVLPNFLRRLFTKSNHGSVAIPAKSGSLLIILLRGLFLAVIILELAGKYPDVWNRQFAEDNEGNNKLTEIKRKRDQIAQEPSSQALPHAEHPERIALPFEKMP